MKTIFTILIALIISIIMFPGFSGAEQITKTFAWDEPADLEKITVWELHWGNTEGGPYAKLTDIQKNANQPAFEAQTTVDISGQPGTTQTRYFVLTACGNLPQADGSTKFECSANSNEVNFSVWIPATAFSVPVNFRIVPTP